MDTLVNLYKRASRPEEETEEEHADWYKGPGKLLVIKVDSVCFIVRFCNLHWCHMIFMYQISHIHTDKTVLWCWQGLLFLIHRTEKLLSNETRHHQHRSKTLLLGRPTISFPPNPLQYTPCPLPACPPNHKHTKSLWQASLAYRFWSSQQLNNRLLHIPHQEPCLLEKSVLSAQFK